MDREQLFKNTKRWALLSVQHTSHFAAQSFAFVACQLDDLSKFAKSKLED